MAPYNEDLEVDPYERCCLCEDLEGFDSDQCEDCKGSGTYITRYNPQSKWDYHGPIDGEWDITVDELPERSTYAILSPEGAGKQTADLVGSGSLGTSSQIGPRHSVGSARSTSQPEADRFCATTTSEQPSE